MLGSLDQHQVTAVAPGVTLSAQALEQKKAKLLEGLDKAVYVLSWSVRNARSRKNVNALRNYQRKRIQIKRIRAQLSGNTTQDDILPQEEGTEYLDPMCDPYTLVPNALIVEPHQVKDFVRQAIMNEFWTHTVQRPINFPGCRPSVGDRRSHFQPNVLVLACHITANTNPNENKFAVLSNEVPAPQSNDLQRQFQQLQSQMREIQQQLQGHGPQLESRSMHHPEGQYPRIAEPPYRAGGRSKYHASSRYVETPESLAQGEARRHTPSYHPQYDHSTLAPRRRTPPPPTHRSR